MPNGLKIRVSGWRMFFAGDISFSQAFHKTLPTRWQPKLPQGPVAVKLFGKPFIVPDGVIPVFISLVSEIVHANQYHAELIHDGAFVIDAGANMGIFSIFVARKFPKATIYGFEPVPDTFAALKENVRDYPNIKIFNYGLGEENRKAFMVLKEWSIGHYVGDGDVPIEIRTLDSFALRADFLKIDTEGYEANILKGAAETIKKYKPAIVMSAYHKAGDKENLPKLLSGITPYACTLKSDFEEDLVCLPA
jgi:FkbM family methyltransferase